MEKPYWPAPIEWVLYSFVPTNKCPYLLLKRFYAHIVETMTFKSGKQLYNGLTFNKNPFKSTYLNLEDDNTVANALADLLVNCAPPKNKNVFYVLMVYQKPDERKLLSYANQLLEKGVFAVAAFPDCYLEFVSPAEKSFVRRDLSFHTTVNNVLTDIVQLIVKRKDEMKIHGDSVALRGPSPTGASELFSDKESVDSDELRVDVMRDGVPMPAVPKPLSLHLAEDFKESSQPLKQRISPEDSSTREQTTTVDARMPATDIRFQSSKQTASSKKLQRPVDPPSVAVVQRFTEDQIVRPSSRLSQAKSETNLSETAPIFVSAATQNVVEICSPVATSETSAHFAQPSPSFMPAEFIQQFNQNKINNLKRHFESLFKPLDLKVGSYYDVLVTHVCGQSEFYVQPFVHGPFIETLAFTMNLFYSMLDDDDLQLSFENVVRVTDLTQIWCAAPFRENDVRNNPKWDYYRAKLVRRLTPSLFQVLFVDYGDTIEYQLSSLKILPESFRKVGEVAMHCRLVQPKIPVEALIEKTEGKRNCVIRLEEMVDGQPLVVSLFTTDGRTEENVGETLASLQGHQMNGHARNPVNLAADLGVGRGRKRNGALPSQ